ncbi:hypothetical protein P5609_004255 [Bacillus licheniformis]
MSKVASEVVAGVLNEFHLAIKKHDTEQAKHLFDEAKSMFSEMEEDQNVLAYFSLLEERYRMMLYDARGERLRGSLILMLRRSSASSRRII